MNKPASILLAVLGLIVWQPVLSQQGSSSVQTLRGADAAASDQAPVERPYAGQAPGTQKRIARTFSNQPPLIPHTIEGVDTLTLEENACLSCHGPENYKLINAPKPSDSHFRDRDGKTLPDVSAARRQCMTCHVPQADAKPMVENTFRSDMAGETK